MGGGLESCCVGPVCGADVAVRTATSVQKTICCNSTSNAPLLKGKVRQTQLVYWC